MASPVYELDGDLFKNLLLGLDPVHIPFAADLCDEFLFFDREDDSLPGIRDNPEEASTPTPAEPLFRSGLYGNLTDSQ